MDGKQPDSKGEEETDTLPPMVSQQQQQQQQTGARAPSLAGAAASAAAAAIGGRRGTVAQPGGGGGPGGGGPRRSIAAGLLNRATLMSLGSLARRSKAQEVRMENTYRMTPKDEERLRCWKLRPLVADALTEALAGYAYNPATAGRRACDAALAIRNRARDAGYERYKFVVFVAVMENRSSDTAGMCLASRALWAAGPECADSYTEAACTNATTRAHATVHAVYFE